MKLSDYLKSLVGKEFTSENIATISSEIDVIKGNAVTKIKEENKDLKTKYGEIEKELTAFRNVEKDAKLKDAFTKAGGNPEKFESFKKVSGDIEDLETFNFEDTFNEFESLKVKEPSKTNNLSLTDDPKPENKMQNKSTFIQTDDEIGSTIA